MSDDQKKQSPKETPPAKTSDNKDEQLSSMLNEALREFGTPVSGGGAEGMTEPEIDEDMMPPFLSPDLAQRAAADFQNMLKQLASIHDAAAKSGGSGATTATAGASNATDTQAAVDAAINEANADPNTAFLNNLRLLSEKAGKIASAQSQEEFVKTMEEMQSDEIAGEFMPFMHGLMQSLLSKELMYPSLKEMVEKYPKWLEDNKANTPTEDYQRYEAQLSVMKELMAEYDSEKDDDSDETRFARFDKLMMLMQKMQMCGHPPAELVGEMPPGWDFDPATGMPRVNDPNAAAESGCTIQ